MSKNKSCSELILVKKTFKDNFAQVHNDVIRDSRLDFKSSGLLVYLLSLQEGKEISIEYLCKVKLDGEASVRSAKNTLEKNGYLKVVKIRDDYGRYSHAQWVVRNYLCREGDIPDCGNPVLDNPAVVLPAEDNGRHINTAVDNTQFNINTTTNMLDHVIPEFGESEAIWKVLCSRIGVDENGTRKLFAGVMPEVAIDVLTELYARKMQKTIKKSVSQYLYGLIQSAKLGSFQLAAGISLRAELPLIVARENMVKMNLEKSKELDLEKSIGRKEAMDVMKTQLHMK